MQNPDNATVNTGSYQDFFKLHQSLLIGMKISPHSSMSADGTVTLY